MSSHTDTEIGTLNWLSPADVRKQLFHPKNCFLWGLWSVFALLSAVGQWCFPQEVTSSAVADTDDTQTSVYPVLRLRS